jgi:hypothetical protein
LLALLFAAQVLASQAAPAQTVDRCGDRATQPYQSLYARGDRANLPAFPAAIQRTVVSLPVRQDRATAYTYTFPNRGVRASPVPVVTVPVQTFPLLLNPSVVVARVATAAWSQPSATGITKGATRQVVCTGYANVNRFGTINLQRGIRATGYQNVNRFGSEAVTEHYAITATGYHNLNHFGAPLVTQVIPTKTLLASGLVNTNRFGSISVTLAPYYLYPTGYKEVLEIGDPMSAPRSWFIGDVEGTPVMARKSLKIRGTPPFSPEAIVAEEAAAGILAPDMKLVAVATNPDGTAVLTFYNGGPWTEKTTPVVDVTEEA